MAAIAATAAMAPIAPIAPIAAAAAVMVKEEIGSRVARCQGGHQNHRIHQTLLSCPGVRENKAEFLSVAGTDEKIGSLGWIVKISFEGVKARSALGVQGEKGIGVTTLKSPLWSQQLPQGGVDRRRMDRYQTESLHNLR